MDYNPTYSESEMGELDKIPSGGKLIAFFSDYGYYWAKRQNEGGGCYPRLPSLMDDKKMRAGAVKNLMREIGGGLLPIAIRSYYRHHNLFTEDQKGWGDGFPGLLNFKFLVRKCLAFARRDEDEGAAEAARPRYVHEDPYFSEIADARARRKA